MKFAGLTLLLLLSIYLALFAAISTESHEAPLHRADAIVVLGAAAWGERPSPVLKNRIQKAVELYSLGLARYIIFTGGTPKKNYTAEGPVAAKWALKLHIPRDAILIDGESRNTLENLLAVKKIARENHLTSFILVSDVYHLTRAKIYARLLGLKVETAATSSSRFPESALKARLKTYFKETNSTFAGCVYYLYLRLKNSRMARLSLFGEPDKKDE